MNGRKETSPTRIEPYHCSKYGLFGNPRLADKFLTSIKVQWMMQRARDKQARKGMGIDISVGIWAWIKQGSPLLASPGYWMLYGVKCVGVV